MTTSNGEAQTVEQSGCRRSASRITDRTERETFLSPRTADARAPLEPGAVAAADIERGSFSRGLFRQVALECAVGVQGPGSSWAATPQINMLILPYTQSDSGKGRNWKSVTTLSVLHAALRVTRSLSTLSARHCRVLCACCFLDCRSPRVAPTVYESGLRFLPRHAGHSRPPSRCVRQ